MRGPLVRRVDWPPARGCGARPGRGFRTRHGYAWIRVGQHIRGGPPSRRRCPGAVGPRRRDQGTDTLAARGRGAGQVTGQRRRPAVVVIDDHPVTGAGLAAQLSQQGFDVAAVITAVEELAAPGDMVVCDLRLPGRSGPDAIGFLIERGWRVLATSGVAMPEEILDAIAIGAPPFVPKTPPLPLF